MSTGTLGGHPVSGIFHGVCRHASAQRHATVDRRADTPPGSTHAADDGTTRAIYSGLRRHALGCNPTHHRVIHKTSSPDTQWLISAVAKPHPFESVVYQPTLSDSNRRLSCLCYRGS